VSFSLRLPSKDAVAALLARVRHLARDSVSASASAADATQGGAQRGSLLLSADALEQAAAALGNGARARRASHDGGAGALGSALHAALERSGAVEAELFIEWWLLEDAFEAVHAELARLFPGSQLTERHDAHARYLLPKLPFADVFEALEARKERLKLDQYAVSDPTLEMIFNSMAAKQDQAAHN
jgi:hypothetical protein